MVVSIGFVRAHPRRTTPASIHSHMGIREWILGKRLGNVQRLSYEVRVKFSEGTNENGTDFIVHRDAAALATAGKGAFDDDLIAILHRHAADHFQSACIVLEKELKGRLTLLVRNLLHAGDLADDDHFLTIIMLRVRDHFGKFQQLGGSWAA